MAVKKAKLLELLRGTHFRACSGKDGVAGETDVTARVERAYNILPCIPQPSSAVKRLGSIHVLFAPIFGRILVKVIFRPKQDHGLQERIFWLDASHLDVRRDERTVDIGWIYLVTHYALRWEHVVSAVIAVARADLLLSRYLPDPQPQTDTVASEG